MTTSASKSVLIVDDESNDILALSAVLIPRGYNCRAALNGEQCIRVLEDRVPLDIILMDVMMPYMNGIEAIKKIRQIPLYSKVKIIVITADDSLHLKLRSMAAGANGFISKPVDVELLVSLF